MDGEDSPHLHDVTLKLQYQINGVCKMKMACSQDVGKWPAIDRDNSSIDITDTDMAGHVTYSSDFHVHKDCTRTDRHAGDEVSESSEHADSSGYNIANCVCDINNSSLCECEALNSQFDEDGEVTVLPMVMSKLSSYV